jgi:hypothetical protein
MAALQNNYGTNGQAITITLAGLATAAARASTAIDNATNKHQDALVMLKVKTNAAGVVATGYVEVLAYGTVDGGTTYTEGATGSDAGITLSAPTNARTIGIMNANAVATTYSAGPWSVAAAFGGTLPEKWGIIVRNQTGAALDATEGNHAKLYQGVESESV